MEADLKNGRNSGKRQIFNLGELFCGPGGLALGAARARVFSKGITYGIEHAWASDYHLDTCETFRHNIASKNPDSVICGDVRKLDIRNLPSINAFAYGFPCNDFSIVGEQKGFDGKFGPLYSYGIKILEHFKPVFFVAENVGGIRSANEGGAFKKILEDFKNAGSGYTLTAHFYKFEEYGVPQTRHRVIIVGIKRSLGLNFNVPAPTTLEEPVSAREALENPPIPDGALNNEETAQSKSVIERLKYIKPGENAWTADMPLKLRLKVKNARLSQIYKRLHPDKPAYTITGSGGGGTHGYHWKYNRALTNRERARLQTFPDNFIFKGSKESVRRQIGMAVSPRMAEIIFKSVLKTIAGIKYPSIEANLNHLLDIDDEPLFVSSIVRDPNLITI